MVHPPENCSNSLLQQLRIAFSVTARKSQIQVLDQHILSKLGFLK